MEFKPLNNNVIVLVQQNKVQENTLFISQNNLGEVQLGKVVSSNCPQINCGESVVFFKFSACPYVFNSVPYSIVNGDDCMAVIREEKVNE